MSLSNATEQLSNTSYKQTVTYKNNKINNVSTSQKCYKVL